MKKRTRVGPYKTVFKGLMFDVQQARAVLPGGRVKTFERALRKHASVCILALDNKGRLLLTREYRSRFRRYLWRLPAGRVDAGESPRAAAQRELQEEAGFKAKKLELLHFSDDGQTLEWKRYTYVATGLTPSRLVGDEDEDIAVVPTPLRRALAMVRQGKIKQDAMAYLIFKLCNRMKIQ